MKTRILKEMGPVHALLLDICPPKDGVKSIPILARHLQISSQALYVWCGRNRIPEDRINEIAALAEEGHGEVSYSLSEIDAYSTRHTGRPIDDHTADLL